MILTCSIKHQVKASESCLIICALQCCGVYADLDRLVCGVCEAIPTNEPIAIDGSPVAYKIDAIGCLQCNTPNARSLQEA